MRTLQSRELEREEINDQIIENRFQSKLCYYKQIFELALRSNKCGKTTPLSIRHLIVCVKRLAEFVLCHVWIFDYNSGAIDNVNESQLAGVARDNVGVYMRNACA